MDFHMLDATAANLIAAYPKVQAVRRGEVPVPEVAEFFITNHCSFRCPHCRCAGTHEGAQANIDLGIMQAALDDLAGMGVRTIEFGGGGEPLEHPLIIEILGLLQERGMRCGIITSGYALIGNDALAEAIAQVADWVRISLDAIDDESYRIVHGRCDLSYAALREALTAFAVRSASFPDQVRTRLGIKLIVQECNKQGIAGSFDEVEAIGADYLQFKWLENHPAAIPAPERPRIATELEQAAASATFPVDLLAGYGDEPAERAKERCVMSILHPLIDWDGSIYACAFFHHRKESHRVGHLRDAPFRDIWGSARHKAVMGGIDPAECVPNCPMKRYNPIIEFIDQEAYRFHYI